MAARTGKGAYGKATRLHGELVRARGACERCGSTKADGIQLQCAHIVSRQRNPTRTLLDNAFCLCASCHWYVDKWPVEMTRLIEKVHGGFEKYESLKALVDEDYMVISWKAEVERLQEIESEADYWVSDTEAGMDNRHVVRPRGESDGDD